MKNNRMNRICESNDQVMQSVATSQIFLNALKKGGKLLKVAGTEMKCKKDAMEHMVLQLHNSVDGRGLKQQAQTPSVNRWVTDSTTLLSGGDYVQALHVRGNLLPSGERNSRGRRTVPVLCEAGCNAQYTLAHLSQSCVRTHNLRCKRHDSIVDLLVTKRSEMEYMVIKEPTISTCSGTRHPDLVFSAKEVAYVIDVTVTSDNNNMDGPYQDKVTYYNSPDVNARMTSVSRLYADTWCDSIELERCAIPCFLETDTRFGSRC